MGLIKATSASNGGLIIFLTKKVINPPFQAEVALIRPILETRLEILQKILFAFLVELKLSKISF